MQHLKERVKRLYSKPSGAGNNQSRPGGNNNDEPDTPRRVVFVNNAERTSTLAKTDKHPLPDNRIRTTKYTWWNFLPKNLFEQFHRFANIYFLVVVVLNWIPAIGAFGRELAMIPLLFVLAVTAIKDIYEDRRRYRSDTDVNNRLQHGLVVAHGHQPSGDGGGGSEHDEEQEHFRRLRPHLHLNLHLTGHHHSASDEANASSDRKLVSEVVISTAWKLLKVGHIVLLRKDEIIPADMVVLQTSENHGMCFIETANLDGETNLKQRMAVDETQEHFKSFPGSELLSAAAGSLQGPSVGNTSDAPQSRRQQQNQQAPPNLSPTSSTALQPNVIPNYAATQQQQQQQQQQPQRNVQNVQNVDAIVDRCKKDIADFQGTIVCELPHANIYEFDGFLVLGGEHIPTDKELQEQLHRQMREAEQNLEEERQRMSARSTARHERHAAKHQRPQQRRHDDDSTYSMRSTAHLTTVTEDEGLGSELSESNSSQSNSTDDDDDNDDDDDDLPQFHSLPYRSSIGRRTSRTPSRAPPSAEGSRSRPSATDAQGQSIIPINSANLILRGCVLRNTQWVLGVIVYAGPDTKAMLNNSGPRSKRSKLERSMNLEILVCIGLLLFMSLLSAILSGVWLADHNPSSIYIYFDSSDPSPALFGFLTFWTQIIVLQVIIPISLYITIELVKLAQAYLISCDLELYHPETDRRTMCRALNINEDLGQIEYLFCDKTGTLTQNQMVFRKCSVNGTNYSGHAEPHTLPHAFSFGDGSPSQGRGKQPMASPDSDHATAAASQRPTPPPFSMDESAESIEPDHANATSNADAMTVDPVLVKAAAEATEDDPMENFFIALAVCNTVVPGSPRAPSSSRPQEQESRGKRAWKQRMKDLKAKRRARRQAKLHARKMTRKSANKHAQQGKDEQEATVSEEVESSGSEAPLHRSAPPSRGKSMLQQLLKRSKQSQTAPPETAIPRESQDVLLEEPSSLEASQENLRRGTEPVQRTSASALPPHLSVSGRQMAISPSANVSIDLSPSVDEPTRTSTLRPSNSATSAATSTAATTVRQSQSPAAVPSADQVAEIVYEAESPDEAALVQAARQYGYTLFMRSAQRVRVLIHDDRAVELRLLHVLPFDSDRKRMSVIVQLPRSGQIRLLSKGADSAIYERLAQNEQNDRVRADTQTHLDYYAADGLRTLCLAYRDLSDSEYQTWQLKHRQASLALKDRKEKVSASADSIENELTLLGATGIEDKLQNGVPDAIATLRAAGIKVWVLTGDKQETAINIGFSCKLLEEGMPHVVINAADEDECEAQLKDAWECKLRTARRVQEEQDLLLHLPWHQKYGRKSSEIMAAFNGFAKQWRDRFSDGEEELSVDTTSVSLSGSRSAQRATSPEQSPSSAPAAPSHSSNNDASSDEDATEVTSSTQHALIIDGASLAFALGDKLRPLLLNVSTLCRVVICCRATPLQKARVVRMVKKGRGAMTMAVGDGANDVSMIQTADVGIGISGQEGMQAVMASDFAIAQFRFLVRLLLVHGHWSYYRLASLIFYFLYKNATFVFVIFLFQFWCGFTGAPIIDQYTILFYNLLFTSVPPLVNAVLDQNAPAEALMRFPELYQFSMQSLYFSTRKFWVVLVNSLYQACVIFFFSVAAYQQTKLADYQSLGMILSSCCVVIVLLYLGLETRRWTVYHHIALWASIAVYFVFELLLGLIAGIQQSTYFVMENAMTTGVFWFTLLLCSVTALLPSYLAKYIRHYYLPLPTGLVREADVQSKRDRVHEQSFA
ncbi:ATPase [Capsaspora owczarzaki ATCC 30864]|nr:ATPase [Capsaspora owczarzaki ATCC 30864]|eukprot:XP_004349405.1 ATPase [Capsaspora owczarzaki ATCC 30864]